MQKVESSNAIVINAVDEIEVTNTLKQYSNKKTKRVTKSPEFLFSTFLAWSKLYV